MLRRNFIFAVLLTFCLAFTVFITVSRMDIFAVNDRPKTWVVPVDFPNITSAIQSPEVLDGDTILVLRNPNDPEGAYREGQINVTKSLNITADTRWGEVIVDGMQKKYVFRIEADDVVIKGLTLENASTGIILCGRRGCIVENNTIRKNTCGIHIGINAVNCSFFGNVIEDNQIGIDTPYIIPIGNDPTNITLYDNLICNNTLDGARLSGVNFNVRSNEISNNGRVGLFISTRYSVFQNNELILNKFNLHFSGEVTNEIDPSNKVNGKSIYFIKNVANQTFNPSTLPNAGYVAASNVKNITISQFTFSNNFECIRVSNAEAVYVKNVTVSNYVHGIWLYNVNNSLIWNCIFEGYPLTNFRDFPSLLSPSPADIYVLGSFNNVIANNLIKPGGLGITSWGITVVKGEGNNIYANRFIESIITQVDNIIIVNAPRYGVRLVASDMNKVFGNNITAGFEGVLLSNIEEGLGIGTIHYQKGASNNIILGNEVHAGVCAVKLQDSDGNTISYNQLSAADVGISLKYSNNNVIHGNVIFENQVGINLTSSCRNTIYHNDLIRNVVQAYVVNSTDNFWDGGSIFGGNYWSDYNGTDVNGDGIGDTPYVIDEYNVDRYPLIYPCNPHDVAIESIKISGEVAINQPINISVTVTNLGVWTEKFNLNLKCTVPVDLKIGNQTITLVPKETLTLSFSWTPPTSGIYEFTAYTSPIAFDVNMENNRKTAIIYVGGLSVGGNNGRPALLK